MRLVDHEPRVLVFDMECLAAGYADPQWVPDKVTVAAWGWLDSVETDYYSVGKRGYWTRKGRGLLLRAIFQQLRQPGIIAVGHNIARFDLPSLNAEAKRCGVEPIAPGEVLIQDTIMSQFKTKGWKKGLDNQARYLGIDEKKQAMDFADWDLAYEEDGWPQVISRCRSDVHLNKLVYIEMQKRGWLKPPAPWGEKR